MPLPVLPIVIVACITLLGYCLIVRYRQLLTLNKISTLTELKLLAQLQQQQKVTNELVELKEKFAHDILYDSLTDLPGRKVFEDRLILLEFFLVQDRSSAASAFQGWQQLVPS